MFALIKHIFDVSYYRSILVKMLYLRLNNCFQILPKAILLPFALGLTRFGIIAIIVGVVLYTMLILQISSVTINTAVSLFCVFKTMVWIELLCQQHHSILASVPLSFVLTFLIMNINFCVMFILILNKMS